MSLDLLKRLSFLILVGVSTCFGDDPTVEDILARATQMAADGRHATVTPAHFAATLLATMAASEPGSTPKKLANTLGLNEDLIGRVVGGLNKSISDFDKVDLPASVKESEGMTQLLRRIEEVARAQQVSPELSHALLALLDSKDPVLQNALPDLKITSKSVADLVDPNGKGRLTERSTGSSANAETIAKYTKDMSEQARKGEITMPIGREELIGDVIDTLMERFKNNPALIGEAGTGKTSIAEGVAIEIHRGNVPERLKGKRVLQLDMDALVAGTKNRGMFEENLKTFLKAVEEDGNIILFIDEVHQLKNLGSTGEEGGNGAAQMFKPLWSKGLLPSIVATTTDEYNKFIAKDPALVRRFNPNPVFEMDELDTKFVLDNIRNAVNTFHRVTVLDEAIDAAYELTHIYQPKLAQPDKAISVMYSAAAKLEADRDLGLKRAVAPLSLEIQKLESQIRLAEKKRDNESTRKKLRAAEEELAKKKNEKDEVEREFKRGLEIKVSLETALSDEERAKALADLEEIHKKGIHVDTIGRLQIANIVAKKAGVPVSGVLSENERDRIRKLPQTINDKVIAQKRAAEKVHKAVRQKRGKFGGNSPIGLIFGGASGLGKSLMGKVMAGGLFGNDGAFFKLNMAKYGEAHAVANMWGGVKGYTGFEEDGDIIGWVKKHPYSVVMLDEIEKAEHEGRLNKSVYTPFLQIFDDGFYIDPHGERVDFSHIILLATTNVRADLADDDSLSPDEKDDALREGLLERGFLPEFLNRFGAENITVFKNFGPGDIKKIMKLEVAKSEATLDKYGIVLKVEDDAQEKMIELGYDPKSGGRGLRPAVETFVEGPVDDLVNDNADLVDHHGAVHVGYDPAANVFVYQVPDKGCPGKFALLESPVTRPANRLVPAAKKSSLPPPSKPDLDMDAIGKLGTAAPKAESSIVIPKKEMWLPGQGGDELLPKP